LIASISAATAGYIFLNYLSKKAVSEKVKSTKPERAPAYTAKEKLELA
jgi:hypothetical protein